MIGGTFFFSDLEDLSLEDLPLGDFVPGDEATNVLLDDLGDLLLVVVLLLLVGFLLF